LTLAAVVLVALAAKAGPANAHEEISPTSNLALGIGTSGLAAAIVALIVAGRRPRAGGVGGRVAREEQQW